jgi:phosphohistidine phosphatase
MEVYIFRHGIAADAVAGQSDADRALTDTGRKKAAEVIRTARRAGVDPSLIVSSPYLRAIETARIAAEGLGYRGEVLRTETLVPHGTPEDVWSELRDYDNERAVLLAGHEPLLGRLVAWLLAAPALRVDMKKAAMVRIDLESLGPVPQGTLRWMITPSLAG